MGTKIGKTKRDDQFLVGFALETDNCYENARGKMVRKNADMIVLNSPSENTGFGHSTNKVTIISKDEQFADVNTDVEEKDQIAYRILQEIEKQIK